MPGRRKKLVNNVHECLLRSFHNRSKHRTVNFLFCFVCLVGLLLLLLFFVSFVFVVGVFCVGGFCLRCRFYDDMLDLSKEIKKEKKKKKSKNEEKDDCHAFDTGTPSV